MTINRPAGAKSLPQTINHYDMATNYKGNPRGGTTPYEQITDDRNVTAKTWYHQDKIYDDVTDPNNPVWNSNGSYTDAKGNTRQTQESWNTATNVRTRTVKWRTAKGVNMVLVTTFQRDRSGTGTMSANGNQIGTLTWGTNGKGTMTVGGSVTSNITMHY